MLPRGRNTEQVPPFFHHIYYKLFLIRYALKDTSQFGLNDRDLKWLYNAKGFAMHYWYNYLSGYTVVLRTNTVARTKSCDAKPFICAVNQRWCDGVKLYPKIQTQICNNSDVQTNGGKENLKSRLNHLYLFRGIK